MTIRNIDVEKILTKRRFEAHPNDLTKLGPLADSINQFGMKIPILVRETDQGYRLIDGMKRLSVWRMYHLGKEIPCIVLDDSMLQPRILCLSSPTIYESLRDEEKDKEIFELYTMAAVNIVRYKMDKKVLEEIVKFLHKKLKLGYNTIAQRLGYSKAGIQKIIGRIEKKEISQATDLSTPPSHYLKRLRTELKKLAETIPSTTDDADNVIEAIRCLNDYLDSLIKSA